MNFFGWMRRRRRPTATLISDAEGFTAIEGDRRLAVAWCDVDNVTAFKRDLMTTDLLCLLIGTTAGGAIEIHEERPGYPAFEAALTDALGIGVEWKLNVLFPAFETKATRLYGAAA